MKNYFLLFLVSFCLFGQGGSLQFQTYQGTGTGATTRSGSAKLLDLPSVKDYGATGSTTAIVAASSIPSGSTVISVNTVADFTSGDGILITGAGVSGANYIGTVLGTGSLTSLVITPATSTTVTMSTSIFHDDTVALQAALAANAGKTLFCPSATYYISSALTFSASTTLTSASTGLCIIQENTIGVDGIIPAAGTVLDGIELQGPWTNQSVNNCAGSGGGGCAINGSVTALGVILRNSVFSGWGGHCINTGGGYGWVVQNNTIQNCADDGILLVSTGGGDRVEGNTFTDTGSNSIDINTSGEFILNNKITHPGYRFTGTDFYGIDAYAGVNGTLGQLNTNNNEIAGNKIYSPRGPCIDIRAGSGTANGNNIHDNFCSANSDTAGVYWGVQLDSSVGAGCTGTVNGTIIHNNTIYNAYIGIGQGGGTYCTITNSLITENAVYNSVSWGIVVAYGLVAQVALNNIQNSGTGGFSTCGGTQQSCDIDVPAAYGNTLCNYTTGFSCAINENGEFFYDPTGSVGLFQISGYLNVLSTGNTQIGLSSSQSGSVNRLWFLDQYGNAYLWDATHSTMEMEFGQGNNHEIFTNGAFHIGASGSTWFDFGANCAAGSDLCPNYAALTASPYTVSSSGTVTYCRDCNASCSSGGSGGAFCFRQSGTWVGYASSSTSLTNPMTTLGDTIYGGSGGTPSRLAGTTSSSLQVLTQTGTGSASAAPVWKPASSLPNGGFNSGVPTASCGALSGTNNAWNINVPSGSVSTCAVTWGGSFAPNSCVVGLSVGTPVSPASWIVTGTGVNIAFAGAMTGGGYIFGICF